jgi:hypothetical protein
MYKGQPQYSATVFPMRGMYLQIVMGNEPEGEIDMAGMEKEFKVFDDERQARVALGRLEDARIIAERQKLRELEMAENAGHNEEMLLDKATGVSPSSDTIVVQPRPPHAVDAPSVVQRRAPGENLGELFYHRPW